LKRSEIAEKLKAGLPHKRTEEEEVTVSVTEATPSLFDMMPGADQGQGAQMQDMLSNLMPKKKKKRKMKVKDARRVLILEEASKLLDT